MSSPKLIRWSGLLAMLGSLLWIASWGLAGATEDNTRLVFGLEEGHYRRMSNASLLLFMLGMVAFYWRQEGRAGKMGKTGFVVTMIGYALMLGGNVLEFGFVGPLGTRWSEIGWITVLVGVLFLPVGFVIFGISTSRAKAMSGWRSAAPLIVGLAMLSGLLLALLQMLLRGDLVGEIGLMLSLFALSVGWIVMGYALWSDTREALAGMSSGAGRLR